LKSRSNNPVAGANSKHNFDLEELQADIDGMLHRVASQIAEEVNSFANQKNHHTSRSQT